MRDSVRTDGLPRETKGHQPEGWVSGAPLSTPKPYRVARIQGEEHVATRVRARDRDAAILEFLSLTNYHFEFTVYVESLNSITSVARLAAGEYAQVFTSGISPFSEDAPEASGPTERFIRNYGLRPHHMEPEEAILAASAFVFQVPA